jgi:hypothetical protein
LPDPFASSDKNMGQLIDMLTTLGDDLTNTHDWSQFIREFNLTTDGSTVSYALPADYKKMIDQTGWNRSTRRPIIGPVSGQETQFLKARLTGVLIEVAFRIQGNLLVFPVTPAASQSLYGEYLSSYWCQTAASSTGPDADHPTSGTDYVLYDSELAIAGLRLAFQEAKGFDTAASQRRYNDKLEQCISNNIGARTLNLAGSGLGVDRLIDTANAPITGYGS